MPSYKSILLLTCLSSLGCTAKVASEDGDIVSTQSQEIVNGQLLTSNSFGDVAIFHREPDSVECDPDGLSYTVKTEIRGTNKWWPRPCSGKVIRKTGTNTYYVLTARHCTTTDGEIDGVLTSAATDFRVTTNVDPKTLLTAEGVDYTQTPAKPWFQVNQAPSTFFPTATILNAGYPTDGDDHGEDLAILVVTPSSATHFSATTGRIALSTHPVANGDEVYSQGYGRSMYGHCSDHNISGAGYLRLGTAVEGPAGFPVSNVGTKMFEISPIEGETTDDNVALVGGDSGSPIYTQNQITGIRVLAGVASSGREIAGSDNLIKWIMAKLGYLYLISPDNYWNNQLFGVVTSAPDQAVRFDRTADDATTRVSYDWTSNQLKIGPACVQDIGNNITVTLKGCTTSSNQKWILDGATIKSSGTARCLTRSGSYVIASACVANLASQRWMFVTDNESL
jgi:hypothetical protein